MMPDGTFELFIGKGVGESDMEVRVHGDALIIEIRRPDMPENLRKQWMNKVVDEFYKVKKHKNGH